MASDALISLVVEQLVSYAQQQVTLVTGAREEVGKLSLTLKIIQGVVADAEVKQVQNSAVKVWLAELRDVIYAADDVLDEWQTRARTPDLHLNTDSGSSSSSSSKYNKVLSLLLPFCHCFQHVSVRYGIGLRIKEIRERLDVIAKEREQYGLVPSDSHNEPTSVTPLTSSVVDASEIRGRDHDKQIIMDMLLGHGSLPGLGSVHVISIVGTGGFGKTTLAKLVFNQEKIKTTFETRMWVCVSQPFDLPRISKEIIEQAMGGVSSFHGSEALHQHLSNSVKGKRFLLILDDVWTNDLRDWEPLKLSLSDGAPGSRIVVTTRNREVAMMLGSTCIHDLSGLSEEDSWSLLSHVALRGREQDLQNFKNIGKEIAFKCKGVPLALQTLASLLYHKRSIQDWRDVADSNLWEISQIKDFFLPSLFISYYSLSSISKQCFLYCSVFPKDYAILKSELVELWMAQGFFGYGGNRELEKIGGTHFDVLAMSSFFQDFRRDSDGRIFACKMHDLVHDFAQFLSQGECFNGEGNAGEFDATQIRHLLITNHNDSCIYEAQNVRTYMGLRYSRKNGPTSQLYGKLLYLRTLDLSGGSFEELPSEVNKLLHLRYIDLSSNDCLTELPEAICNLINLQTLKLTHCSRFCKLPERIGDLSNLRRLAISFTKLTYLPQGIKRLIFLRRLSKFIVGGLNGESKLEDLAHLRKLQQDLQIVGLDRITDANEAAQAGLNEKKALDSLTLEFTKSETVDCVQISTMNSVLERLKPPEYLKYLSLIEYPGDQFPSWMQDSSVLGNLVSMFFSNCTNTTNLPALGKLESLGRLDLSDLNSVKHVGRELFGGDYGLVWFPKLGRLRFADMIELVQWEIPSFSQEAMTSRVKVMPNLRDLTVTGCPKLRVLPDISIFKSLETLSLCKLGEWVGEKEEEEEEGERRRCTCLISVAIKECHKLKVIPHSMFSPSLRKLVISHCPGLRGKQPYLPPLLEKLVLTGDAGIFSESLPLNNQLSSSINYFSIYKLPHSSLPNGVSQLKALQTLLFEYCETLDFDLKDLQQLTMLQFLTINECPILHERFQGEGWRNILSHVSNITLNGVEITKSD